MQQPTIVLSINASWNVFNFRLGLVKALQAAGYRVVALAPHDRYSERLVEEGMIYEPITMDNKGVSPSRDLALLWRYHRALRRLRPDLFLGYTAKPNIYGSLAAHMLGIPTINNVSGLGTAFIRGGLLGRLVKTLYTVAFRRSRVVFFQNSDDLTQFVSGRIVSPSVARLLPGSGINLSDFAPSQGQSTSAVCTFLLVARLLRDKGIGEFISAARMVKEEYPEARFQLLGPAGAANRTAITPEEVEEWVREGVVEYLGQTDDVRPFIAAADCVVLPSYREGLPRSLLEGAAMGKPLIATDVPGCRAVVEDGVNGYLCPARDPRSLAEAMIRMLRLSAENRAALGAAARKKVEEQFSEATVIRHYLEAIREALPSR
jgi:glycosyltransferase involved in cell wall biosynthesis